MVKLGLAVIEQSLTDLFTDKRDKETGELHYKNAIDFFCNSESHYLLWLKTIGIKEWQHPFFMLCKFQLRHKRSSKFSKRNYIPV